MTNVARMMISLLDRVGNTVGKGENAGYQKRKKKALGKHVEKGEIA